MVIFAVHGYANKREDALRIAEELHIPRRMWKLYPGQDRDWAGYRMTNIIHVYEWMTPMDLLKALLAWLERN